MDFFRRGQRNANEDGEGVASSIGQRAAIRARLTKSITDLQLQYGEGNLSSPIPNNELTHGFLTAIEAIFIHGLKGQPTRAVKASASYRNLPDPSFWNFVLVFSHKETINYIEKLSAIKNDAGRGRAWIRMALNDGSFNSYLVAMTNDKATLRRHYHRHSMLRDGDTMDILIRYLSGIEIYSFDIALNSGLLNRWATGPLILAGLCISDTAVGPNPSSDVAVDAAAMLDQHRNPMAASTPAQTPDLASEAFEVIARPAGYLNRGLVNEDEALKLILESSTSPVTFSGSSSNNESLAGTPGGSSSLRQKIDSSQSLVKTTSGKSGPLENGDASKVSSSPEVMISRIPEEPSVLATTASDSNTTADIKDSDTKELDMDVSPAASEEMGPDEGEDSEEELIDIYCRRQNSSSSEVERDLSMTTTTAASETLDPYLTCFGAENSSSQEEQEDIKEEMRQVTSYVARRATFGLLSSSRSSTMSGDSTLTVASVPYLSGFIDSWHPFGSGRYFDTPPKGDVDLQCGFKLQPSVQVGTLSEEDSQDLMLIFDQVAREQGLDIQNYECAECTRAIGTIFGPAKLCGYTKRYYCEVCHVDETSSLPSKIMYNWDFRQFRVCHKAKLFLSAVNIEPIIDVKSFNGDLFDFAPSLSQVFDLRRQLRYMNAYLTTCTDPKSRAKDTFDKMLYPRQYLYEDVDMYSIRDLEEIHSGRLNKLLEAVVKFSLSHIVKCILCKGKGFICEICRADSVIFPFELDSIMQCKQCKTVFHLDCSIKMTTCPKCDRIEARNLNWQVSLSKAQRLARPEDTAADASSP